MAPACWSTVAAVRKSLAGSSIDLPYPLGWRFRLDSPNAGNLNAYSNMMWRSRLDFECRTDQARSVASFVHRSAGGA